MTNQSQKTPAAKKNRVAMTLTVISTDLLSSNIKRIVFAEPSKTLLAEHESGYVKLTFNDTEGNTVLRSYTILEAVDGKLTIDFVLHKDGHGATWAKHAQVGDTITAMGPGPAKLVDTALDWFIIMGDLTALPAIAVNLKTLTRQKPQAKGYAIIEVLNEDDIQTLVKPDGIEIEWIINANTNQSPVLMQNAIGNKTWLTGTPYVWIASEFASARTLRQYFREEKGITKNRYVSSYWKIGETDEGNKKAKKADGGF